MYSDDLYQNFITDIELNDKIQITYSKKHFKQFMYHYYSKYEV